MLFVRTPLQPPMADAEASQFENAVFTATCVWQAGVVVLVGQANATFCAAATVKVAWQVVVKGAQLLV